MKRRVLRDRHIQSKKEREKVSYNAKNRKDEEERTEYLKRKKEEKMMQLKKQEALEVARKAWQLAKLHHSLVLLRQCFLINWNMYVQERRLLWVKAIRFWTNRMKSNCFLFLFNYTQEKRLRNERNQFRNAGKVEIITFA